MRHLVRAGACGAAAMAAFGASAVQAGGSGGCAPCSVPTGHNVDVPGINVVTPTITVNTPTINVTAPTVDVQSSSVSYAQAYAASDATATASGQTYANALSTANAAAIFGGGGGGYSPGGQPSYLPALTVVEGARVCTEWRSIARVVAVQAVCLDDKAVPHPASQVEADRQIGGAYEGEVFRCIAGTHMQYTLGAFAGAADFAHGQTMSCLKGEALYHAAGGALACRPQKPARDCNERSLLRRYGAGIKLIGASARECVAWSGGETASAGAASAIAFDGGVGGP